MPDGTTYTWSTTPDVSEPGTVPGVVKVTYPDGSVDEVPVNVHVGTPSTTPTTTTNADQNDPTGKDVTTTIGIVPEPGTAITWPDGQPTGGTPTYTWSQEPNVYSKGQHPGVVQVTYPDGSVDYVPTTVTVTNAPTGKNVTTPKGTVPAAPSTIDWGKTPDGQPISQPTGTTVTWEHEPDVSQPGDTTGTAKITYPDGETTTVVVPVHVTDPDAPTNFDPYWTTISVPYGHDLTNTDAQNAIAGGVPSDATDVTYTWKAKPATNISNTTQQGYVTVKATVNGQPVSKYVLVYVHVGDQADNYNPQGQNLTVPKGATVPAAESAITNTNTLPNGTNYEWAYTPDTSVVGTQSTLVKVTYPDGSVDYVPVNVTVTDTAATDADKYNATYQPTTIYKHGDQDVTVTIPAPSFDPAAGQDEVNSFAQGQIQGQLPFTIDSIDPTRGMIKVTIHEKTPKDSYDIPVKINYKDGSSKTVNAKLTVASYAPSYNTVGVKAGQQKDDPIVPPVGDTKPADATFTKGTGEKVPTWATVDHSTGTITLKPGADVTPGVYKIPVNVTSLTSPTASQTITAIVNVIGATHDKDGKTTYYGDNYNFSVTTGQPSYHKTTDGTENVGDGSAVGIIEIDYNNEDAKTGANIDQIVYKLSADGTEYVAQGSVSGITLRSNGEAAPERFAASDVKTTWADGFKPNTNVVNFPITGTATMTAADGVNAAHEWDNKDNDQRVNTPGQPLDGNSKFRVNDSYSGTAASILGISSTGWINVFANFYGAKTGEALTFKQNSDISNLTQAQYRQLIDVTDLGAGGWNGINTNPNAPQVLAYVPGTDTTKSFTMMWAPDKMPSTANVAHRVSGTVRIAFNDGTYLDIPATISVVKDDNAGKPDQDKTAFTQKIVYTYNGQEVAYTTIDNIAKGTNLSANQLKSAIDDNVPADYTIADGFTYPAAINNIVATPSEIKVPLTLKDDVTFNATGKIVYQTADGMHVGDGDTIKSKIGDTLTAGLLHDLANDNVPSGYTIVTYPGNTVVSANNFTVPVIVKQNSETPSTTDADKYAPSYQDTTVNATAPVNTGAPSFTDNDGHATNAPAGTTFSFTNGQTTMTISDKNGQNPVQATINATTGAITFTAPDSATEYDIPVTVAYPDNSTDTATAKVFVNKTVNPTKVDPTNPDYKDMFTTVTRDIITTSPAGAVSTNTQKVDFGRTMTIHGNGDPATYGTWEVGKINGTNFTATPDGSTNFADSSIEQVTGYDSYYKIGADGQEVKATTVPEASALNAQGTPTNGTPVYVSYQTTGGDHQDTHENFSQNIVYQTADGVVISTVQGAVSGQLTNGSATISATEVNHVIDQHMPAGYDYVSGKLSQAETINSTTPAAITVTVKKAGGDTPTPTPTQGEVVITYVEQGNESHVLGTTSVSGTNGSTVNVQSTIENNVPEHWQIAEGFTIPSTEVVPGAVQVPLVHATKTIKPTDPGVNPTTDADMFKTVTRTINVKNPVTGNTDTHVQKANFSRSKTIDEVTNKVVSYGTWTPDEGQWNEFDAPEFAGYTPSQAVVEAETVTADTADQTVTITYSKSGNGDHNNPGDHTNPGDNDHHNNGGNTNPGDNDHHNNGGNTNPGDNNNHNNGGNTNPGNNNGGQPTNTNHGNGNNTGDVTGNGNGGNTETTVDNHGNGQNNKQTLPQTGDTKNTAAVAGLGLASLTALLGLGGLKKKND